MEDIQEILEDFLVEAFELIEQLDQNLVELETKPDDLELLNSIFRVAHTIKSSSSFLAIKGNKVAPPKSKPSITAKPISKTPNNTHQIKRKVS